MENKRWLYLVLLFLALALLGTAYGHWFSTIILISQVDIWKSQTNTDAA